MVKAIELRVGNKFKSCFGQVQTVLSIIDNTDKGRIKVLPPEEYKEGVIGFASEHHKAQYSHLILCEENGNQYKPCEIEGEPLTSEWLDRFGFTNEPFNSLYIGKKVNNQYFTLYTEDKINYYFFYESDGVKMKRKVEYVHRLQNIYLDFTEEELILEN